MEDRDPTFVQWCRRLPKVELHAHLHGSIREATIEQLIAERQPSETAKASYIIAKGHQRSLEECFYIFGVIHRLVTDCPTVERITREVLEDYAADGAVYVELRTTPRACVESGMTRDSYIQAVLRALRHTSARLGIHARLLLSIHRKDTTDVAMETVALATKYKEDGVVGIDLSGPPMAGQFAAFVGPLEAARHSGLRTTLHFAEILNPCESVEMLSFGPDRIGHGCCLTDDLHDMLTKRPIPIELCLTSNVLSGSVGSYNDHHFADFYARGYPIVLGADDSGVFATTLSKEYTLASDAFSLSKADLFVLAKQAVEYIFAEEDVKTDLRARMARFETDWTSE